MTVNEIIAIKRSDTALRGKIKKLHKELSDMLIRPMEKRYVPRELVKATAEILDAIDTTSGRAVKAKAALAELKVRYESLAKDDHYALVYDETVGGMIQELAENIQLQTTAELESSDYARYLDRLNQYNRELAEVSACARYYS